MTTISPADKTATQLCHTYVDRPLNEKLNGATGALVLFVPKNDPKAVTTVWLNAPNKTHSSSSSTPLNGRTGALVLYTPRGLSDEQLRKAQQIFMDLWNSQYAKENTHSEKFLHNIQPAHTPPVTNQTIQPSTKSSTRPLQKIWNAIHWIFAKIAAFFANLFNKE